MAKSNYSGSFFLKMSCLGKEEPGKSKRAQTIETVTVKSKSE
jgi:hypothetical protein